MSTQQYSGREILKQIGIQVGPPVIVFLGEETKIKSENSHYIEPLIREGIARAAEELRASVVDGGIDSGMLAILNTALSEHHHPGYYIGVAPSALTHLPNQPIARNLITLGNAHTHFILVEGENWGDEIPVMQSLINALAEKMPYLTISVNGSVGQSNREENIEDGKNAIKTKQDNSLEDKILLQLHYPKIVEYFGLQKFTRGETLSAFDINVDPEKLANEVKYLLKAYSSPRKDYLK